MQQPHTPSPSPRSIVVDLYLLIHPETGDRRLALVREDEAGHVAVHTRDRTRTMPPAVYAEHVAPYAQRRFVLDADAAALVRCADAGVISHREALAKLEEVRPRLLQTAEERAREREAAGRLVADSLREAQDAIARSQEGTETRATPARERAA